ncbi:MAG: MarC family protein [Candidatus Edwardsbacteria bacterium]
MIEQIRLAINLKNYLLTFIPIFIATDVIGSLPIFLSLTSNLKEDAKKKIIHQSILTASLIAIGFILLGRFLFWIMGISVNDFLIAGGILLFLLSIKILMEEYKEKGGHRLEIGVVPLGTPLIAGPALLTASLMLTGTYGFIPTLVSMLINIVLAGFTFSKAQKITRILGVNGTKALAKVMSLFLGAYAVMMVRKGVIEILGGNCHKNMTFFCKPFLIVIDSVCQSYFCKL